MCCCVTIVIMMITSIMRPTVIPIRLGCFLYICTIEDMIYRGQCANAIVHIAYGWFSGSISKVGSHRVAETF